MTSDAYRAGEPLFRPDAGPKEARGAVADRLGPMLLWAIDTAGMSKTDVARALGVRRSELYDVIHGDRRMPAEWLFVLPPQVRALMLGEAAGPEHLVVEAPPELDTGASELGMAADAAERGGSAAGTLLRACADHCIDAAEGVDLEHVGEQLAITGLQIREVGRCAQRERVIGLHAVAGGGGR